MRILVRLYNLNRDKTNITVHSIDEALKIVGKKFSDVYLKHDHSCYVNLYFVGTKDYIIIDNSHRIEYKVTSDSVKNWAIYLSARNLEEAIVKLKDNFNREPNLYSIIPTR